MSSEKEQTTVLCISFLPLTPTQQTWSPTGRLVSESSSSLLTIVLFFLSSFLSLLFCCPPSLFVNSYSWEAHSHPKVSVGESCQRAQGLSKQGESSPLPFSLPPLLPASLSVSCLQCCSVKSPWLGSRPAAWAVLCTASKALFIWICLGVQCVLLLH